MTEPTPLQAPELVRGPIVPAPGTSGANPPGVVIASDPTQMRKPWRATVRTILQVALGIATLVPLVAGEVYATPDAYPAAVAQVLAVSAGFARVMALPQVERFLRRYRLLSFLAASK